MKTLTLFLSILFLTTQSYAFNPIQLQEVQDLYQKVNQVDLVDFNYYIAFTSNSNELSVALKDNPNCLKKSSYKKKDNKQLLNKMYLEVSEGIQRGYEQKQEVANLTKLLKQTLQHLKQNLSNSKIEICTSYSSPAYSDGHEITFLKVDSILSFAFEVGYPD